MKDKRITTIDLWKFLFVIAIVVNNVNNTLWKNTGEKLILPGVMFISFFMFISGYFLMEHFKKKDKSQKEANVKAWNYTKKRFSYLYPALLGGVSLAFIVRNVVIGTKFTKIFSVFINSIWEFLGLSQIGIMPINTGISTLWNEPLWYISSLLIASLILYYIVAKSEDFFKGLFAPLFIIISFSLMGNSLELSFPLTLVRVMAGLTLGMLSYYIVEYFNKLKFKEALTMMLSIIHIILAVIFIYTAFKGITWSNYVQGLLMFVFCIVLLVNKDYVADLYNDSKLCNTLGRLALYIYACHIAFVYFLAWCFPEMGYHASLIFNILFSTCWAFIMLYFDDYVISPIFRKKK